MRSFSLFSERLGDRRSIHFGFVTFCAKISYRSDKRSPNKNDENLYN